MAKKPVKTKIHTNEKNIGLHPINEHPPAQPFRDTSGSRCKTTISKIEEKSKQLTVTPFDIAPPDSMFFKLDIFKEASDKDCRKSR